MSSRELKNKPLVEAIFEIRWKLQEPHPGIAVDPHYRLLLGRLYDRLEKDYPQHEQLETANIPDEMAGHVVQHRFRVAKGDWPLVQLGPGVFTVNDTHKYRWNDFRPRVLAAVSSLYEAYPKQDALQVENLMLRYVDAVEFDYISSDIFEFLKENLKINIGMPDNLFADTGVEQLPQQLQCQQAYRSSQPRGIIQLRIATGQQRDRPALIWETMLQTPKDDIPSMAKEFESWLDKSHSLVNDWFFKMIEGNLRRSFSGD